MLRYSSKLMTGILKSIDDALMNRLAVGSYVLSAASGAVLTNIWAADRPILAIVSALPLAMGGLLLNTMTETKYTRQGYLIASRHIRETGSIDYDFMRKSIPMGSIDSCEYCQLQGMYIAARDLGKLKEFNEARSKMLCPIPNF